MINKIAETIAQLPKISSVILFDSESALQTHGRFNNYEKGSPGWYHALDKEVEKFSSHDIVSRLARDNAIDETTHRRWRRLRAETKYTDQDWTMQAAMRLFLRVLHALPEGIIDSFTKSAEIDFLRLAKEDALTFEFLEDLDELTCIGDLHRTKQRKKACRCLQRQGPKCQHQVPAPYPKQLAQMREQLFNRPCYITKLNVIHLNKDQSLFWKSRNDVDTFDPLESLEELSIGKSEVFSTDLVEVAKRTTSLQKLVLKDVYLVNRKLKKDSMWSGFFDNLLTEKPQSLNEIIIQGVLYHCKTGSPWKREEMLEYFDNRRTWHCCHF